MAFPDAGGVAAPMVSCGARMANMLGLWDDCRRRAGTDVPRWRDFRPADLVPFAVDLHVFSLCPEGMRVRFVGTNVDRIYGGNVRAGMVVPYFLSERGMEIMAGVYRAALDVPCGVRIRREVMRDAAAPLIGRALALPAASEDGTVDTMIILHDLPAGIDADDLRGRRMRITEIRLLDIGHGLANLPAGTTAALGEGVAIRADLKGQRLLDE